MSKRVLTVLPTELAKRRFERQAVLRCGVVDTSRRITFRQLLDRLERAARTQGLLRGASPQPAERALRLERAVEPVQFAPGQPLAQLAVTARASILRQLIEKFAFLAADAPLIEQYFLGHAPHHKLHGLGQLLRAWRAYCAEHELADRFAINRALLELIHTGALPEEIDGPIHFRAVRWFNPFEERLVGALKQRLGNERVLIYSILPPAHAEAAGDRLRTQVRSAFETAEEWMPWTEDFADAYEADDSNILGENAAQRVHFFISAHPYGEIEDAARRIAAEIEHGTAPEEIALILRQLSPYTDIVPNVFERYGIPYYFRRGRPAAALPQVKALLALLTFSQNRSRDRLCDLLLHPGIQWPGLDDPEALAQQIRATQPPRLQKIPRALHPFFPPLDFTELIDFLIQTHQLELPDEVHQLIEELAPLPPLPLDRMASLFEKLLANVTLPDPKSTERGVWILNPIDAAGLHFNSIFLAGMDDRTFPQIPKADALLNSHERQQVRQMLDTNQLDCPRLALSETAEALIQEAILFLTVLGCATERLHLSYTRGDFNGKERAPGEFFARMRQLAAESKLTHGESFQTILPPDAVRAIDEARQTASWLAPPAKKTSRGARPIEAPALRQWLQDHPEFSATALEALARNRFVFFLEKMVQIQSAAEQDDQTDPRDRGTLIHNILEQVYRALAQSSGLYAKKEAAGWRLAQRGEIPLVALTPKKLDDALALCRSVAHALFERAEKQANHRLGHPTVWKTERATMLRIVENYIRLDCKHAARENRYPALFEQPFDRQHNLPVGLTHRDEAVGFKGKIDRIDLIFDESNQLDRVLVIDYKSPARDESVTVLEQKIALNLDCQLPLYTFAAQTLFFGEHNTSELNRRVQAVYHLQEKKLQKMESHFTKKRLSMTTELSAAFESKLFENLRLLRSGDLATEPLIRGYTDYDSICRTTAISPSELLK